MSRAPLSGSSDAGVWQVVKQAWLNKRGHMMKGYRQKRRYFVLTRCGYLHFFPNKW
jgi:hypothetical protein